jgi:SAM-dependent methyltransferase
MIPDWQLPPGVDRGLHDYMHSADMVDGYDAMMAVSPLAGFDVEYCRRWCTPPGRVVDLGCGTGRLARVLVPMGFEYVGVDLSEEMLAKARAFWANPDRKVGGWRDKVPELPTHGPCGPGSPEFLRANLVELPASLPTADFAACLFSTLGMVVGEANRAAVVKNVFGLLRLGGRFVLHVHNRHFHRLGLRGWFNPDITSRQAYGGAPLTIHHFTKAEAVKLLEGVGFRILDVTAVGTDGPLKRPWLLQKVRAYGWLIAAERPVTS